MKTLVSLSACVTALSFAGAALCEDSDEKKSDPQAVLVTGQRIDNYKATDALTGTKVDAELRDLPLSVTVVPQQLIADRAISYLGEALDTVSGAQRKLGYGGTQNFGAFIRGFDQGWVTLRNGARDFGYYTMRDAANVERFEVLKGPASILYGTLAPGGITNTITKQPLATPAMQIRGTAGSNSLYRAELDAGGPLSERVFYRANVAYEDAESYRDLVTNKSWFVAPVISWLASDSTRWTVEAEYKHSDFLWDLGLPRDAAALAAPIERFLGEPDRLNDVDSLLASSTLEHAINAHWSLRQHLQYAQAGGDYYIRSPLPGITDGRTVARGARYNFSESKTYVAQHELSGRGGAFGIEHQLVLGAELYRTNDLYRYYAQSIGPIDLFEPVYGTPIGAPSPLFGNDITNDAWGLYAQDLIALAPRWKLLAGTRYDSVKIENLNAFSGATVFKDTVAALSPQLGLVYQPSLSTSLYTSYSTSFVPIGSGTTVDGQSLDPEKGRQLEIGLKHNLLGGRMSATLAGYWITKTNVSTADLANPGFRVQIGEQKSKGVELDIAGALTANWDIVLAGSLNDAYVSRDNTIPAGTPLDNAADWTGSLWSKYSIRSGALTGLAFGAGVYASAERQVVNAFSFLPLFDAPGYTRFDAMVSYGRDQWLLQLNGKNLTSEKIYDLMGTTIMPEQPRSWILSLSVRM